MVRRLGARRLAALLIASLVVVVAVAIPVLAASPAPSGTPGQVEHPGKGPKESKPPETAVTVHGRVGSRTDADGSVEYTLTADGKTLRLSAGPPWFWGDKNPLKGSVGKTVTITGSQAGDEIDVETVDGVAIREPGRPPWAGGWKAVGSAHPGWSQAKADRFAEKAKERGLDCWPPGLCKPHGPDAADEPDESEAPGG
jgi:hypothetical protein